MQISKELYLSYDDVQLVPQYSDISSRNSHEINTTTSILPLLPSAEMTAPLISANMDTVTELEMAQIIAGLGGRGIIHRFLSPQKHKELLRHVPGCQIACIGVGNQERDRLEILWPDFRAILIDIAHGHCQAMLEQISFIRKKHPTIPIIAGNIATGQGALDLINAGADCVKVGIGPSGVCSTRWQTGCGIPQFSALLNVAEACREVNRPIGLIADGGIKHAGDVVKALAAGADAVMIGKLFAGTRETPGPIRRHANGHLYKQYRGSASRDSKEARKEGLRSIEGESVMLPYVGSVKEVFNDIMDGVRSGFSYVGAHNITELRERAHFICQTRAGQIESSPHALLR